MKILILGTGYLGSEIAFSLSKTHNITCIDHGNNSSKLNFKNRKIKFFQDDLKNENLIKKLSRDVDLICYCINTGGVVDCLENSDLYKKINIDDFKKLLKLIDNKKCNFLLLSTAFVYSDSEMNSEDCTPNPETLKFLPAAPETILFITFYCFLPQFSVITKSSAVKVLQFRPPEAAGPSVVIPCVHC